MINPVVSVIIPVYNKHKYIKETINSVLLQNFTNFEIIIVDDGSTDGSLEVIRECVDARLQIFSQSNSGVERARNFGFSKSVGSYIVFLDADDIMRKDRLIKQIDLFESKEELKLLGTWAGVVDNMGKVIGSICPPISNEALQLAHLFRNQFVSSSVMIRRNAIDHEMAFNETRGQHFAEDYDLWHRISRNGLVANIPEKLTTYRRLNESRSQSKDGSLLESARNISAEWLYRNTNRFESMESARTFVLSINGLDDFTPNIGCNMRETLRTYDALLNDLLPENTFRRSDGLRKVMIQHKIHITIWSLLGFIPVSLQRKIFSFLNLFKSSLFTQFLFSIIERNNSKRD